jgi:DNA repair exonuclease SbcCD ATPase subunit
VRSNYPRVASLSAGEEHDPGHLMNLLDDIDGIKREIQERMRRVDAVREAKSFLQDESSRTEMLNQKLSEMNRLISQAQSGTAPSTETSGYPSQDGRATLNRYHNDGSAIPWPTTEGLTPQGPEMVQQLQPLPQDLLDAFDAAMARLATAEESHADAMKVNAAAQFRLEQAEAALAEIRSQEDTSHADLLSARQELTTAYQFASVAAQRRLEASEFFERTARWSIFASLFSWIATVWIGWIALIAYHKSQSILLPLLGTLIFVLGGTVLIRRRIRRSEDH